VTVAVWESTIEAIPITGASGLPAVYGMTALEAAEGLPVPAPFVAATVNV
jgi:hypothetical protein